MSEQRNNNDSTIQQEKMGEGVPAGRHGVSTPPPAQGQGQRQKWRRISQTFCC